MMNNINEKRRIPVLKGVILGKIIKVWCPHCCEWHVHGALEDTQQGRISHRAAHCSNYESPLRGSGYYIQAFSQRELAEIK